MSLEAHPLIGDWLGVQGGRLLLRSGKVDIGQRISTALLQIAHEELTVAHDGMDIAPVRTGHAPDEGITSGSNSIEQSGNALRRATATLRVRLIARAVEAFGGAATDWVLEDGSLHLPGTNHRLRVADMISPEDLATPVDLEAAPLGGPASDAPRMRGIEAMVQGSFTFLQDIDAPGMLHARIIRPPHARARLRGVDADRVARLEDQGLTLLRDGSFLAVTGPREWPVVRAAQGFQSACDWDLGAGLPEADIFAALSRDAAQRFPVIDGTPQKTEVPPPPEAPDYTARFERPYQMHGALGPSAAMAEWDGATLTLKSHSQGIYPLRLAIADSLGLTPEQVDITHVPGSGCYGHNGADDAAYEAALIARACPNRPVLLKWTREDEHAWEPFAPAMAVEVAATLRDGRVAHYSAEAFSDTHRGRPRPGPNRAGASKLLANRFRAEPLIPPVGQPNMGNHAGMHRNLDPIYAFPERRLVKNLVTGLPHRTSALRCLGAVTNVFALECAMDALARAEGADPLAFRRAHLTDPRALAILEELERRIAERPLPDGGADVAGRGVAYAQYKNQMTRVGLCVDVTVNDRAEVTLRHVTMVADAGRVVDREGLIAQLEGGFVQGASWALCEEVTWDRDGITSRDWDSYPVIRFDAIPEMEVILLEHPGAPSVGAGEASPGPAVAAIANAIHDAICIRMQRMPFRADDILRQALDEG